MWRPLTLLSNELFLQRCSDTITKRNALATMQRRVGLYREDTTEYCNRLQIPRLQSSQRILFLRPSQVLGRLARTFLPLPLLLCASPLYLALTPSPFCLKPTPLSLIPLLLLLHPLLLRLDPLLFCSLDGLHLGSAVVDDTLELLYAVIDSLAILFPGALDLGGGVFDGFY